MKAFAGTPLRGTGISAAVGDARDVDCGSTAVADGAADQQQVLQVVAILHFTGGANIVEHRVLLSLSIKLTAILPFGTISKEMSFLKYNKSR
jgi:hypothetical protein